MEIQFYRTPEPSKCSAEDQAFFDELDRQIQAATLEESQKSFNDNITAEKNQPKSTKS